MRNFIKFKNYCTFNLVGTPGIPENPGPHGIPGTVGQKGDKGRVPMALLNILLEIRLRD